MNIQSMPNQVLKKSLDTDTRQVLGVTQHEISVCRIWEKKCDFFPRNTCGGGLSVTTGFSVVNTHEQPKHSEATRVPILDSKDWGKKKSFAWMLMARRGKVFYRYHPRGQSHGHDTVWFWGRSRAQLWDLDQIVKNRGSWAMYQLFGWYRPCPTLGNQWEATVVVVVNESTAEIHTLWGWKIGNIDCFASKYSIMYLRELKNASKTKRTLMRALHFIYLWISIASQRLLGVGVRFSPIKRKVWVRFPKCFTFCTKKNRNVAC